VSAAGQYNVTVTDSKGCTGTGSGNLTVNPNPVASVNSATICSSAGTATLGALLDAGPAPFTFSWTGPGGFTASTQTITVSAAGQYNATVTDSKGCTGNGSGNLTVNPNPVASVNSATICASAGTATLGAAVSSGTAPFTFSW